MTVKGKDLVKAICLTWTEMKFSNVWDQTPEKAKNTFKEKKLIRFSSVGLERLGSNFHKKMFDRISFFLISPLKECWFETIKAILVGKKVHFVDSDITRPKDKRKFNNACSKKTKLQNRNENLVSIFLLRF